MELRGGGGARSPPRASRSDQLISFEPLLNARQHAVMRIR